MQEGMQAWMLMPDQEDRGHADRPVDAETSAPTRSFCRALAHGAGQIAAAGKANSIVRNLARAGTARVQTRPSTNTGRK